MALSKRSLCLHLAHIQGIASADMILMAMNLMSFIGMIHHIAITQIMIIAICPITTIRAKITMQG
jgi:hypothetical protein